MIFKATQKEEREYKELYNHYAALIAEQERLIDSLRSDDIDQKRYKAIVSKRTPRPHKDQDAFLLWQDNERKINEELDELYTEWEKAGSQEWRDARKKYFELMEEEGKALRELYARFEIDHFKKFKGDPLRILEDARWEVKEVISRKYKDFQTHLTKATAVSQYNIRALEDGSYKLDARTTIEDLKKILYLHYDALKYTNYIDRLDQIVYNAVFDSPYTTEKEGKLFEPVKGSLEDAIESNNITTRLVSQMVVPVDKLSNQLFDGNITDDGLTALRVSRKKSNKEVTAVVSIDYEGLNGVEIKGKRELSDYDREVHNAITSLYVEGENEYITANMIFHTITGNEKSGASDKQAEAISNSITKLMFSHLFIDNKEEAAAYKVDHFRYDASLLPAERVTVTLNNNVVECIHLFREPPLYSYADTKKQVGRMDIKLLNTPVNKNEEVIVIQSYLYRRILAMKGSSHLSPTVLYDTIYKKINIEAASDGALRKKKNKVRDTVRKILDFWKAEKFIKGYSENKKGQEIVSVTIRF